MQRGEEELVPGSRKERIAVADSLKALATGFTDLSGVLFVFAHPDDEVLAVGGRLERMSGCRLITITDGCPRDGRDARNHGFSTLEEYRCARTSELSAALAHAGLPSDFVVPFPQRVSDQTASYHLVELTRAIAEQIVLYAPKAVLTHPYEGGHPDHDACAFAVHAAVRLPSTRDRTRRLPVLMEAPFYNAGEDGSMRTGAFLPNSRAALPVTVLLSPEERENKRVRLAYFQSQAETLRQFALEREVFRLAPPYDFTQPPHASQLFYDQFSWGITGERFRELAQEALALLFGEEGYRRSPSGFQASVHTR